MRYRHRDAVPRIDPTAWVAPTAVLSGDVRIRAHSRVLHGAVLTAEGGPIEIGQHVIVMENAVLRGTARNPVVIGAHSIVGVGAYVVGATVGNEVFLATGSRVFTGAVVGSGSEVRVGATVHLRTTLAAGTVVPIGWVAVGSPAELFSPDRHDEIWAVQQPLDFPGHVFGVDRSAPDSMVQITERWSRALGRHESDERL